MTRPIDHGLQNPKTRKLRFGDKRCPRCKRLGCLDHLRIEDDYPDSAWNYERHDYGPKKEGQ